MVTSVDRFVSDTKPSRAQRRRIVNVLASLLLFPRSSRVIAAVFFAGLAAASSLHAQLGDSYFIIVGGLGGESRYREQFSEYVGKLEEVCKETAGDDSKVHTLRGRQATRQALVGILEQLAGQTKKEDSVALILIGHGTWDGQAYKFNVRGPDITAKRLGELLDALPADRQLVAVTTSSSGASIDHLKSDRRVVIAATRSGRERNVTIFPQFWVEALQDEAADADKNSVITALEAFNYAEQKVKTFFEQEKRLVTEHARIEGGLAASFTLARLAHVADAADDPAVRRLFGERQQIERRIEDLKLRKSEMAEDEYFEQLEELLLELADKQAEIDQAMGEKAVENDERQ